MTCMKYHAFLAFLSVYAKLSFLSRKFALCVIYLPIMCLWSSKTPPFAFAWRKGNVATRPTAWRQEDSRIFSLLQSGQSVACKGIAQLKKTQDPLDICYLFLEESQKASVLGCGINRKCLVFRLEFFLFAVLFEEHATDTDRLRKRVR